MMVLQCNYSDPVNLGTPEIPDWSYSQVNCSTSTLTELIQNQNTGAEFYIQKSISYGDVLVLTFLLLFTIFAIVKVMGDYFIPHRVDFHR